VIENTCLSDKEGKATFYVSNTSYTSSLNAYYANDEKYGGGTVEELTVDLITFDQYMEQHPDLNPGMIKIDAEGHDYEVLKGCLGTIQKYHPSLMVEVNKEERPEIIELLKGYGYKYYSITPYRTPCLVPPSDPIFDQCPDLIFIYDQPLVAIFEQSGI
jgi:hypothetical protein